MNITMASHTPSAPRLPSSIEDLFIAISKVQLENATNEAYTSSVSSGQTASTILRLLQRFCVDFDDLCIVKAIQQQLQLELALGNRLDDALLQKLSTSITSSLIPSTLATPLEAFEVSVLNALQHTKLNNSNSTTNEKKAKLSNGFMNFNFDDLPSFEPLEVTLQILRVDHTDVTALTKLYNMDMSELIEHPQWVELLTILHQSLSDINNSNLYYVASVYHKMLTVLPGYQYIDTANSILSHLYRIWCTATAAGESPLNSTFSESEDILASVLSVPLIQTFFAIISTLLSTAKDHLVGSPDKTVNLMVATLFLVLARGRIEVELGTGELSHVHVLSLLGSIGEDGSSFETLCIHWQPMQLLHHAAQSGLISVLVSTIHRCVDHCKQLLFQYDYTSDSADVTAAANIRKVYEVESLRFIRLFLLATRIWAAFGKPFVCQQRLINHISATISIEWDVTMDPRPSQFGCAQVLMKSVPCLNKKQWRLSNSSSSDLLPLMQSATNPVSSESSSDIEALLDKCLSFLTDTVFTHLNLLAGDGKEDQAVVDSILVTIAQCLRFASKSCKGNTMRDRSLKQVWSVAIRLYLQPPADYLITCPQFAISMALNLLLLCLEVIKPELEHGQSGADPLVEMVLDVMDLLAGNTAVTQFIASSNTNDDGFDSFQLDALVYLLLEIALSSWQSILMNYLPRGLLGDTATARVRELLPNVVGFTMDLHTGCQRPLSHFQAQIDSIRATDPTIINNKHPTVIAVNALAEEVKHLRRLARLSIEVIGDSLAHIAQSLCQHMSTTYFSYLQVAVYRVLVVLLTAMVDEGVADMPLLLNPMADLTHIGVNCHRLLATLSVVLATLNHEQVASLFDDRLITLIKQILDLLTTHPDAHFLGYSSTDEINLFSLFQEFLSSIVIAGHVRVMFQIWRACWSSAVNLQEFPTIERLIVHCFRCGANSLSSEMVYDPLFPLFLQTTYLSLSDVSLSQRVQAILRTTSVDDDMAISDDVLTVADDSDDSDIVGTGIDILAVFDTNIKIRLTSAAGLADSVTSLLAITECQLEGMITDANLFLANQSTSIATCNIYATNKITLPPKSVGIDDMLNNITTRIIAEDKEDGVGFVVPHWLVESLPLFELLDLQNYAQNMIAIIHAKYPTLFDQRTLPSLVIGLLASSCHSDTMTEIAVVIESFVGPGGPWEQQLAPAIIKGGGLLQWAFDRVLRRVTVCGSTSSGRVLNLLIVKSSSLSLFTIVKFLVTNWFQGLLSSRELAVLSVVFALEGPDILVDVVIEVVGRLEKKLLDSASDHLHIDEMLSVMTASLHHLDSLYRYL